MEKQVMIEVFESLGVLQQNGHYVYTSGEHGPDYWNKDILIAEIHQMEMICSDLAEVFARQGINMVAGLSTGGAIMAHLIAVRLRRLTRQAVGMAYIETHQQRYRIRESFVRQLLYKKVLVAEDVFNTGHTLKEAIKVIKQLDCRVCGVAVMCNRNPDPRNADMLGVPMMASAFSLKLESWPEADCPLCASGVPINTDVGHGREFLKRKSRDK